jgi:hypothetical protein
VKKKYIFCISGGLGNQLFMVYAGLYFQEKFNKRVSFDVSALQTLENLHPGMNVLDLGFLNQQLVCKTARDFGKFLPSNSWNRFKAKLKIVFGFIDPRVYKISEVGYFDFSMLPSQTKIVIGYFQSWKYFSELHMKPILNLDSISKPSDWFQEQRSHLEKNEFAAFHVRRGDYNLSKNRKNGLLGEGYYLNIANRIPKDMEILVFTDSENDVVEELKYLDRPFRVLTPPKDSDPVESLLLMSLGSHIAIANSTYSWWSAMMSQPGTKIYAPLKWFEIGDDPVDLLPEHWLRVPSDWIKQK